MRDLESLHRAALRDNFPALVWLMVGVAALTFAVLLPLLGYQLGAVITWFR